MYTESLHRTDQILVQTSKNRIRHHEKKKKKTKKNPQKWTSTETFFTGGTHTIKTAFNKKWDFS